MRTYSVYLIRNKQDKIVYCGMTGRDPKFRFYTHRWRKGEDVARSYEIVSEGLTLAEAAILERKLIQQYSLRAHGGMNVHSGSKNGQMGREGQRNNETWRKAQFESHAKAVICLETGEVYPSARHAAKALNLQYSKISLVCNGKRTTTGNLHFEFYKKR